MRGPEAGKPGVTPVPLPHTGRRPEVNSQGSLTRREPGFRTRVQSRAGMNVEPVVDASREAMSADPPSQLQRPAVKSEQPGQKTGEARTQETKQPQRKDLPASQQRLTGVPQETRPASYIAMDFLFGHGEV